MCVGHSDPQHENAVVLYVHTCSTHSPEHTLTYYAHCNIIVAISCVVQFISPDFGLKAYAV